MGNSLTIQLVQGAYYELRGQLGCARYHTHDTCIWQVDMAQLVLVTPLVYQMA